MLKEKRLLLSSRESKLKTEIFPPMSNKSAYSKQQAQRIFKHSEIPSIHSKSKPNQSSPNIIDSLLNTDKRIEHEFTSPTPKKTHFTQQLSSNSFFSKRIQMRYDTLINQCTDVVSSLKGIAYKDTNLFQIVQKISYIISELQQFKSEKALECQVEKLLESHIRFQEIEWVFVTTKLRDWITPESLFKRILVNCTFIQENKLQIKKNKPDQLFMQILYDFCEKLDELFKRLCEESYRGFASNIKTSRQKLFNKEIEVMHQFAKQSKKDSYQQLQMILKGKFQMNMRAMKSNIATNLNQYEEKNGPFKLINSNHRFISNKIDDLLIDINQ